ncbi:MAG: FGGY-family carbohydrate kinase [Bryobacterales bacterium]|nr:FGGY-family carbohydrate kinase [Bryobacterales bacterium]
MILILDLGTQSFRATVVDRHGAKRFESSEPIESTLSGAIAEQDPDQWRMALFGALDRLATEGDLAKEIDYIAACGTLSGLVCLDENDSILRPAILYSDRRPAVWLPHIESLPEFQPLARRSGWRVYSGDLLPQICYLRSQFPAVYRRSAWLLDATGYLNYLLTGAATMDRYSTYTCYAEPSSEDLPEALLLRLGIDRRKLGRVIRIGESLGPLRPDLAGRYGFRQPEVISVSYDSTAAYLGSPLAQPGEALDISGTVTSFGVLTDCQVLDPERRIFSIPAGPDCWIVRGSTALSGGVLEWARTELLDMEFADLDRAVLASPPGANGLVFLPFLAGARAPIWEPSASGVFFGLTSQTTKPDMARAVYEGICFSLLHIVSVIGLSGVRVDSILLGGGLARNGTLNQMKADMTGVALRALADVELTTMGAASIVARCAGWLRASGGDSFVKPLPPISPDWERNAIYRRQFGRYCALVSCLEPLFSQGDLPAAVRPDMVTSEI